MSIHFDEEDLLAAMEKLGMLKAVFAATCAERHLSFYDQFHALSSLGDPTPLYEAVNQLWQDFENDLRPSAQLENLLSRVMLEIPSELDQREWSEQQAYAEDTAAAVAYAIRAMLSGDSQEAVWAARRCYECADQFAINDLARNGVPEPTEDVILSHPRVQLELRLQADALDHVRQIVETGASKESFVNLRKWVLENRYE